MSKQGLVAFGSNQGDSRKIFRDSVHHVDQLPNTRVVQTSQLRETAPVGSLSQSSYLNAVVLIESQLKADDLMRLLLEIEAKFGRVRDHRWGPRTVDLDLLLLGQEQVQTPELTLPHPRMSFRRFVIQPAAEVAPNLVHPVIGVTMKHLLDCLNERENRIAIVAANGSLPKPVKEAVNRIAEDHPDWSIDWLDPKRKDAPLPGSAKLLVFLQQGAEDKSLAASVARWRGPLLKVAEDTAAVEQELRAAIQAMS